MNNTENPSDQGDSGLSPEELASLTDAITKQRKHAGFFFWYDRSPEGKAVGEVGAVEDLLASMASNGEELYSKPAPSGDIWPDCVAIRNHDLASVAIEVTELVDPRSLQRGASPVQELWSDQEVLARVSHLMTTKNLKSVAKGVYSEVLLLIHTDEAAFQYPRHFDLLRSTVFPKQVNLTGAYLLCSYRPELRRSPYCRLRFDG